MKNAMASIYKVAAILLCLSASGLAYRMQGTITESGTPVAGTVRLLKYFSLTPLSSQGFSDPVTIDAAGKFDISWDVSIGASTINPQILTLVYFAPGETPVVGSPLSTYKRIFEYIHAFNDIIVSPGVSDLPFLTGYADIRPTNWCGLDIKKIPGTAAFEFDATSGWCPEESDKLSTVSIQNFPLGNRISNGSFENYFPDGSGFYPGWSTTGLPSGDNTGLNIPMGNLKPRTGTRAFRLQFTTAGPAGEQAVVSSDQFQVKPNTVYYLVFYYSAKNPINWGTDGFRPRILTYSEKRGAELSGSDGLAYGRLGATAYVVSQDAWIQYYHAFKTGPSATFASLDLLTYNANSMGGTFYFDDVVVTDRDPSLAGSNTATATTTFANGLNKPIQTRVQNATNDIYSQTEYDELDRPVKSSLPVGYYNGESNPNGYMPNVFAQAVTQYDGTYGLPDAGGFPFSETQFEASPVGRIMLASAAGYQWRAEGSHTSRKFYSSTADLNPSGDEPDQATPDAALYSYELTRGEQNQESRQFKDKLGHVVLSQSLNAVSGGWVGTNYEYDPNGNVAKVTSPPGPGGVRLAITTKHNTLGQVLSESSPDFGENQSIYDDAGRLRFTQSQALRDMTTPRMNYVKYDHLGRVIETGEYLDASSFNTTFANDPSFPPESDVNRSVRTLNFYDRAPENRDFCPDNSVKEDYIIRSDAPANSTREFKTLDEAYNQAYSDMAGKLSFAGQVRFIQVFDDPNQVISPPAGAQYVPFHLYSGNEEVGFKIIGVQRGDPDYTQAVGHPYPVPIYWGPVEGRLVQTVSCNPDLASEASGSKDVFTLYNYDKYGNIKDIFEFNGYIRDVNKQWQRTSQVYDTQNRMIRKSFFSDASKLTPEVSYSYSYNALGKLDQVMDQNAKVIGKHFYNSIGQLIHVDVGQGDGQVQIFYTYHIRGWLKKIEAISRSGVRLFLQDLKYEDASQHPRFDGLIAEYDYATSPATPDKFSFLYGDMDRLTAAMTTAKAPGQTVNPQWNYVYYDNGAIAATLREDQGFSYNYEIASAGFPGNSNHLNSVSYTGTNSRKSDMRDNFGYDGSGRMYRDFSRDMSIQYSSNDLPIKFDYVRNGNHYTQIMIYDGAGNRRSKLTYSSNTVFVSAIHYTSTGKEFREYYNQASQEIYPLDTYGRVVKNASGQQEYEAYLKNNLGSTVKIHNITRNTESYRTDYEPYGKLRLQNTTTSIPLTQKFTGKEHDDGTELDYFGARYYDAELGVWISPDHARQFASPYTYSPDPINSVDPDGNYESKTVYADGSSSDLKFWEKEPDGTRTIFSYKVIDAGYDESFAKKWDYTGIDGEQTHVEAAYTAKVDVIKIGLTMKDGVVNGSLGWDIVSSELSLAGNKSEVGSGFKASVKSGLFVGAGLSLGWNKDNSKLAFKLSGGAAVGGSFSLNCPDVPE